VRQYGQRHSRYGNTIPVTASTKSFPALIAVKRATERAAGDRRLPYGTYHSQSGSKPSENALKLMKYGGA